MPPLLISVQGQGRALKLAGVSKEQRGQITRIPTIGWGVVNPYDRFTPALADFTFPPSLWVVRHLVKEYGAKLTPETSQWATSLNQRHQQAKTAATTPEPIEGYPELFPFQCSGVTFLRQCQRVLMGDDTGLGKTAMSLIAAKPLLERGGNVLVLTVKGLIPQWMQEIKRWRINPPGGVINLGKAQKRKEKFLPAARTKGAIVLMNWDALVSLHTLLPKSKWSVVIGDEAHLVKNRKAKRSMAMVPLCKNAKNVWLMTGTPLEKSPADLWMLLHILYPEQFTSYWAFYGAFVNSEIDYTGNIVIKGAKNTPILHDIMKPLYIRRLRADELKDVKEPQLIHIPVELTPAEKKVYDKIEKGAFIDTLTGADGELIPVEEWVGSSTAVGRLIHARQAAISPGLILPEYNGDSSKIDALVDLLSTFDEHDRVVIFSSFRAPCELVQERLGKDAIVYFADKGAEIYQTFAEGKGPRFLVTTPFSLGVGANLQVARAMVFLDCPWSYTQYRQACARIVRIGQVYEALIYHLQAVGTVDQDVQEMLTMKADTFNEVAVARRVLDRLQHKWGSGRVGTHS